MGGELKEQNEKVQKEKKEREIKEQKENEQQLLKEQKEREEQKGREERELKEQIEKDKFLKEKEGQLYKKSETKHSEHNMPTDVKSIKTAFQQDIKKELKTDSQENKPGLLNWLKSFISRK